MVWTHCRNERREITEKRSSWNQGLYNRQIVKSRIKWSGHIVRMKDERLQKRCERKKQEGCRERGRPQLRWEDCVKRDLRKTEEEDHN